MESNQPHRAAVGDHGRADQEDRGLGFQAGGTGQPAGGEGSARRGLPPCLAKAGFYQPVSGQISVMVSTFRSSFGFSIRIRSMTSWHDVHAHSPLRQIFDFSGRDMEARFPVGPIGSRTATVGDGADHAVRLEPNLHFHLVTRYCLGMNDALLTAHRCRSSSAASPQWRRERWGPYGRRPCEPCAPHRDGCR